MKKSKALVLRKAGDVARLQPDALHQIIQTRGLEKCGEIVMLATPQQLTQIFDLDLWRPAEAGKDEQFDADRFGLWLEVMAEFGASEAAHKLTEMNADLVIAGLAQHVRVFDSGVTPAYDHGTVWEIGGYQLFAKRTDSWEAIVAILISLDADHPDYFRQVMRGCRGLSNSGFELDGLDDLLSQEQQTMFDLALDRERRREEQGFVAPAQARAFLRGILGTFPEVARYRACASPPEFNYKFESRIEELAYLANTLMAGCSLQGRPFTKEEAKDAAVAVCKLGLENLPEDFLENHDLVEAFGIGWTMHHKDVAMYGTERLLEVLVDLKCNDSSVQEDLDALRIELSKAFKAGMPWLARDALDVIAILDMPAWAALLGLLDECPILHGALRVSQIPRTHSVSASAFEFISQNSQIACIRQFLQSLPETLRS
jgi:hypothetical protein